MSALPPTRRMRRSWSARSSFTCTGSGSSPTSSRKSVPDPATSKSPGFASTAPVKLPFSWPKSSLSMSPSGMAPQLMATKGWSRRSLRAWMLRATTSLPVPLSPVTSTVVRVGASFSTSWRTSRMGGDSPRISSPPAAPRPDLVAEEPVLGHERPVLERLLEHQAELLHLEGLQHVVVGPELHGLHGVLGGGEGGHDHHLGPGRLGLHGAEQVEPRLAAEPQVAHHQVGLALAEAAPGPRPRRRP